VSSISDRKNVVAERFQVFRESLHISRAGFAVALGIGTERLASYEAARAPLPYFVFKAAAVKFSLNPLWLVGGDTVSTLLHPYDDSEFAEKIPQRMTFLEAYVLFLRNAKEEDLIGAAHHIKATIKHLEVFRYPRFTEGMNAELKMHLIAALDQTLKAAKISQRIIHRDRKRLKPFLKKKKKAG